MKYHIEILRKFLDDPYEVMGDYLRNYLAVGCLCELDNSINMEIDNPAAKYIQKRLGKVRETIIDIMEM